MVAINIEFEEKKLRKYLSDAQRKCIPRASRSALRKTMRGVNNTDAPKVISQTLNVTRKTAKKDLYISNRDINNLVGRLIARRLPLNLTDFKGTRQNKRGIGAKISVKGSRELIKSGFIINAKSGKAIAVIRKKRAGGGLVPRKPIRALTAPSIGSQIDRNGRARNKIIDAATIRWVKEWNRAVNYEINIRRCGS